MVARRPSVFKSARSAPASRGEDGEKNENPAGSACSWRVCIQGSPRRMDEPAAPHTGAAKSKSKADGESEERQEDSHGSPASGVRGPGMWLSVDAPCLLECQRAKRRRPATSARSEIRASEPTAKGAMPPKMARNATSRRSALVVAMPCTVHQMALARTTTPSVMTNTFATVLRELLRSQLRPAAQ